jgi:hypothetical protein
MLDGHLRLIGIQDRLQQKSQGMRGQNVGLNSVCMSESVSEVGKPGWEDG